MFSIEKILEAREKISIKGKLKKGNTKNDVRSMKYGDAQAKDKNEKVEGKSKWNEELFCIS